VGFTIVGSVAETDERSAPMAETSLSLDEWLVAENAEAACVDDRFGNARVFSLRLPDAAP